MNIVLEHQLLDGVVDLVHLHRGIYEHAQIVEAYPNDLNCILQPQRIPDQSYLIEEAEDEDGQVCWNRQRRRRPAVDVNLCRRTLQTGLELAKDVGLQRKADNALRNADAEERPGPGTVG